MDNYKPAIRRILAGHLAFRPAEENIETVAICDETGEHYMLLEVGWQYPRRIFNVVFHIRLKDDRVWVEQDWTEYGVARELLDAGIPAEAIELGFQPPEIRPYTELATIAARER
ncbi:MAG: XisI protein [Chloroflexi bacterium]|nr:XisI protein [Chloroflexota bacterium]